MDELTTAIHTYLTTAPTSNFLQRTVEVQAHWEGSSNLLWRVSTGGEEAVVKLYLDAGQARGRREYDGQQFYSAIGIAPQPLWFDRYPTGLARQVLIYRWVPGTPIAVTDQAQMSELARTVAQVHQGDPAAVRRFCPNPINLAYLWRVIEGGVAPIEQWLQQQQAGTVAATVATLAKTAGSLVETALPLWQNTPPTPVHGDLTVDNTVDSFGAVALLDWELFGLGDPAYEIATFLHANQQALDRQQQEEWLEIYLTHFDQPGLAQRIGVYRRILPFQAVCYLFNGLRQTTADEHPTLVENRSFLETTIARALEQTIWALPVAMEDVADTIHGEITALFQQMVDHPADQ